MAGLKATREKIAAVIDNEVRPSLQQHGGDIELLDVTADAWVRVKLTGACGTCPGARQTLSELVEKALQEKYPEIRGVLLESQVSDELIQAALQILRRNTVEREGSC